MTQTRTTAEAPCAALGPTPWSGAPAPRHERVWSSFRVEHAAPVARVHQVRRIRTRPKRQHASGDAVAAAGTTRRRSTRRRQMQDLAVESCAIWHAPPPGHVRSQCRDLTRRPPPLAHWALPERSPRPALHGPFLTGLCDAHARSLELPARPVFISSTFKDLHAERDWLRDHVFPQLEEELKQRHHH